MPNSNNSEEEFEYQITTGKTKLLIDIVTEELCRSLLQKSTNFENKNSFIDRLFGILLDDGSDITGFELSYRERFIYEDLATNLFAVHETLRALHLSAWWLDKGMDAIPPGLSPRVYTRYHVEAFLNNTYILKERIKKLLNVLMKRYRHSSAYGCFSRKKDSLFRILNESTKCASDLRSSHVHDKDYSDRDIEAWSLFEMISELPYPNSPELSELLVQTNIEGAQKGIRRYQEILIKNLENAEEIVEKIIGEVVECIVRDGGIIAPTDSNT